MRMAYIYELILIYAPAARLCRLSSTHRLLERRKGTHRTDAELSVRVGSIKAYDALNSHSLARTRVYTKVCTTCCHPSPVTDGFTCWRRIIWEHCVRKRMGVTSPT